MNERIPEKNKETPKGRFKCAWCGKDIGPAQTEQDSHGICNECLPKIEKEIPMENILKNFLEIPKEFVGEPRSTMMTYLLTQFPDRDKYDFPGKDRYEFFRDNPAQMPDIIKEGKYRYLFVDLEKNGEIPSVVYFFSVDPVSGELIENGGSVDMPIDPMDRIFVTPK